MKVAAFLILCISATHGWLYQPQKGSSFRKNVALFDSRERDTSRTPCWQELSDDDCAMESIYSAHFVAKEWIQSMPCAKGVDEDCDYPEELELPGTRQESGVEEVDVMAFLNLKRAEAIENRHGDVTP